MIWRMTLVIYFHGGWFQIASIWTSCDLLLVKIWAHHYLQRCIWVPLHDMLDIKFCIAFAMPSPSQDPSRQLGAPVDYYKAVHSAYTNQYLEAALKGASDPVFFGILCKFHFLCFCQYLLWGIRHWTFGSTSQGAALSTNMLQLHVFHQKFDDQNDSGNQRYHLLYSFSCIHLLYLYLSFILLFVCLVSGKMTFVVSGGLLKGTAAEVHHRGLSGLSHISQESFRSPASRPLVRPLGLIALALQINCALSRRTKKKCTRVSAGFHVKKDETRKLSSLK